MYEEKKDAKATVNEVLLIAGHVKDLLDEDKTAEQVGEAHGALLDAVKAMERVRKALTGK